MVERPGLFFPSRPQIASEDAILSVLHRTGEMQSGTLAPPGLQPRPQLVRPVRDVTVDGLDVVTAWILRRREEKGRELRGVRVSFAPVGRAVGAGARAAEIGVYVFTRCPYEMDAVPMLGAGELRGWTGIALGVFLAPCFRGSEAASLGLVH